MEKSGGLTFSRIWQAARRQERAQAVPLSVFWFERE